MQRAQAGVQRIPQGKAQVFVYFHAVHSATLDSLGSAKTFNTKRAVERHSKSLSARLVAPNPSVRADPDTVGGLQVAYKPRVTKTSRGASPITRFFDHEKDGVPNQRFARGVCLSPLINKGWGWPH